jgi:hypothetical protein
MSAAAHAPGVRRSRAGAVAGARGRARVLRVLIALSVVVSALVHLDLWWGGMRSVPFIGAAFLLNAVGGLVIAVLVLVWDSGLPLLAAVGFGAATFGAYVLSVTVGLAGVHEQVVLAAPQVLSAVSEILAVVLGVTALVVERRWQQWRARSARA